MNIEEQKKEWQAKYGEGNCRELIADGKSVFVFDPTTDFNRMKAIVAARQKGVRQMVDSLLANCWLGGDEDLKKDDAFKVGIEQQTDNLIDIPEAIVEELENGNCEIVIDGFKLLVRKATRMDLAYADDRNAEDKPLLSNIYLLERVALEADQLSELRKNVPAYMAALLKVREVKNKKYVEVKKF